MTETDHALDRTPDPSDAPQAPPDDPSYTSQNIRILDAPELAERFSWAKAAALADEFGSPVEFVARGLEACATVGVDDAYFIDRYLRGDKSIPMNPDVQAAFIEISRNQRIRDNELNARRRQC
jgi:hypothetical protein